MYTAREDEKRLCASYSVPRSNDANQVLEGPTLGDNAATMILRTTVTLRCVSTVEIILAGYGMTSLMLPSTILGNKRGG